VPPPFEPASSISEVLARLEAIETTLPPHDGVASFDHLYLQVTRCVDRRVAEGDFFTDNHFLTTLDVVFANRFLEAVHLWEHDRRRISRSWAALAERRHDPRVARIQFALAGMNAHINFDLALALVDTCRKLEVELGDGSQRQDFRRVNDIFKEVEESSREELLGDLGAFDETVVEDVVNAVGHFKVVRARDAAWTNANVVWELRRLPRLATNEFIATLDRLTGFAGRGLVLPLLPRSPGVAAAGGG